MQISRSISRETASHAARLPAAGGAVRCAGCGWGAVGGEAAHRAGRGGHVDHIPLHAAAAVLLHRPRVGAGGGGEGAHAVTLANQSGAAIKSAVSMHDLLAWRHDVHMHTSFLG